MGENYNWSTTKIYHRNLAAPYSLSPDKCNSMVLDDLTCTCNLKVMVQQQNVTKKKKF